MDDIPIIPVRRLDLRFEPAPWRFADERREEIDRHFAKLRVERPELWNGRVLLLRRGEITGDPAENKEAKIYKRSFRGKGKFFLIDEADLMEAPAQNALLKTLEEPPLESYLVLITTSPQELLQTTRA